MIFIKNKKAWKEEVKRAGVFYNENNRPPNEYPCYLNSYIDDDGQTSFRFYCLAELQSMIDQIKRGREF